MQRALEQHHEHTCAVILEPLVQCAGNMRMYHPVYLKLLRQACDQYGVHLIADEIAVGFGRTGTLFACQQAGITPDFMLLSKGLTGGYLPLSVVLTRDEIYQSFYDDYATLRAFCIPTATPATPWPAARRWPLWTSSRKTTSLKTTGNLQRTWVNAWQGLPTIRTWQKSASMA